MNKYINVKSTNVHMVGMEYGRRGMVGMEYGRRGMVRRSCCFIKLLTSVSSILTIIQILANGGEGGGVGGEYNVFGTR